MIKIKMKNEEFNTQIDSPRHQIRRQLYSLH